MNINIRFCFVCMENNKYCKHCQHKNLKTNNITSTKPMKCSIHMQTFKVNQDVSYSIKYNNKIQQTQVQNMF